MAGALAERIYDTASWPADGDVTRYRCAVKTVNGVKVADTEGQEVEGIFGYDAVSGDIVTVNTGGLLAGVSGAAIASGEAGVRVMTNNLGKLIPYVAASGKFVAGTVYTTATGADQLVQFRPQAGGIQ